MPKSRRPRSPVSTVAARSLMVRLDDESKSYLCQAAELRGISLSDYVRTVTVAQARLEVLSAEGQPLALTREEPLAFWHALDRPVNLSAGHERLGRMMRGEE